MVDNDTTKKEKLNIENLVVKTRSDWGGVDPRSVEELKEGATHMVATWTGTDRCKTFEECSAIVRDIQQAHINDEGLPDIKYNFLIGNDYNVYEGRGWNVKTNVSEADNDEMKEFDGKSIHIAFIGPKDSLPYPHMILALAALCHIGKTKRFINSKMKYIQVHKGKPVFHDNVFERPPHSPWLPQFDNDSDDESKN